MSQHFFSDTTVLLGRSLRHISRSMDTITTAIMPIARSSVLWAHVLTSWAANLVSLVVVLVALLMGFRTGVGVAIWLGVAGLLVLFTLALSWLAVIAGLSAKTVDGASAFSYPLIFLPFISSAFGPTETMSARSARLSRTSR